MSSFFWAPLSPQGLRSITQTVGCLTSLYWISPKLTGLLVLVMPALVGAGALIGSFLRQLSRKAQEQVGGAPCAPGATAGESCGRARQPFPQLSR